MGNKLESGTFPYMSDGTIAPYTDGIVSGLNPDTGSVYIPSPSEMTAAMRPPLSERGKMEDYIGATSCVDANTTAHGVFAGDS